MKLDPQVPTAWIWTVLLTLVLWWLSGDVLIRGTVTEVARGFYSSLLTAVRSFNDRTPGAILFVPLAATVGVYAFVFLFKDPMPRLVRLGMIGFTFVLHTVYIIFRLGTFNFHDAASTVASGLLYGTEFVHYLMMCCYYLQMAWPIDRSADADRHEAPIVTGQYLPSVAFFIPTYDEPVSVLRRTIIAAQAVDYPNKTIYLLDDGKRHPKVNNRVRDMRALARELGCWYIARCHHEGAKAGNLNHALSQTKEELIAFLDCDNIPARNFLRRMVGFFYDPEVAMVISSLHYYNAQAESGDVGVEMLTASDHARALSNSQTGRDRFNALLCFGTSYVLRRDPLEAIGGIPRDTLCEDWATSIELQARGYKTYFLDEVLSSGVAAESISGFVKQRLRWCQGTIQTLFVRSNPLRIPGLRLVQRFIHLFGILFYLMFVANAVAFVIPLLYFGWGIVPIQANTAQFVALFLPFFVAFNAMYYAFSRRASSPFSSQVADYLLTLPLAVVVLATFVRRLRGRFDVTPKNIIVPFNERVPLFALPPLCLLIAYFAAMLFGINNVIWLGVDGPVLVYVGWCCHRALFFWMAFQGATDIKQQRHSVRFSMDLPCTVEPEDGPPTDARIRDLSEDGVRLEGQAQIGGCAHIDIPACEIRSQTIEVVCATPDGYGARFTHLDLITQRKLMTYLYTSADRWRASTRSERGALAALGRLISGLKARWPKLVVH